MAKIRNSENTGYLKDGNGDFIDSELFDNSPTDLSLKRANRITEAENDELIDRLFPDLKVDPEEETP